MLTPEQEASFWQRVEKTDSCWLWRGNTSGVYGTYTVRHTDRRQNHLAHRLAFQLLRHPIPRGFCVCHTCDVPTCVNPAHLFVGTQADNIADKVAKNRQARGEQNGNRKLTWAAVRAIRVALVAGETPTTLAKQYAVHRDLIYLIRRNRIWKETFDA